MLGGHQTVALRRRTAALPGRGHPRGGSGTDAGVKCTTPCQLTTFTGRSSTAIAATANYVGWLEQADMGAVLSSCALADGCATVKHTPNASEPLGMTATSDAIFASIGGGVNTTVEKVDAVGEVSPITVGGATFGFPIALTPSEDSNLFLLNSSDGTRNGIYRVDLSNPSHPINEMATIAQADSSWTTSIVAAQNRVFIGKYTEIGWTPAAVPASAPPLQSWCNGTTCKTYLRDIATDGSTLFWTTDVSTVEKCPVSDQCAASISVATSASFAQKPRWVQAIGADLVITTDPGADGEMKIYRCKVDGCAVPLTPIASEKRIVTKPFATADSLFWVADDGTSSDVHELRVMRLSQ
jgi:hypothetical protein